MAKKTLFLFSLILFILAGCGGGGGGGGSGSSSSSSSSSGSGSSSSGGSSIDITPDAFSFSAQTGVDPGSIVTSEQITVSGINSPAIISIVGGEYSLSGRSFTALTANAFNGDYVVVKLTASDQFSDTVTATLTIGGIEGVFSVTTRDIIPPDPIEFEDQTATERNALITSAPVTVSGSGDTLPVSIQGGFYSIDGSEFSNQNGTIGSGQSIRIRRMSSSRYSERKDVKIHIGNSTETFSVTTLANPVPDAPTAVILHPLPNAMTNTDTITVRGTASDTDAITNVTVNGVAATTSDGYQNWEAVVTLTAGDINTLTVATADESGNTNPSAAEIIVKHQLLIARGSGIAYAADDDKIFVTDSGLQGLISGKLYMIEPDTGIRTLVSGTGAGPNKGSGPTLDFPEGLALDMNKNIALIAGASGIVSVDLNTGDRTVVSDGPDGVEIYNAKDIIVDPNDADTAFLVPIARPDPITSEEIYLAELNLLTGNRTAISSSEKGTGPDYLTPNSVVMDTTNNRFFVATKSGLFEIDAAEGHRTQDAETEYESIVLDTLANRLIGSIWGSGTIESLNLDTGLKTTISNATTGTGEISRAPVDIALDEGENRLFVVDGRNDAVFTVDLGTGNRSIISDGRNGAGESLQDFLELAVDTDSQFALAYNTLSGNLIEIDLSTGDRRTVSGTEIGEGHLLSNHGSFIPIIADYENNRALAGISGTILEINLITGDRSIISDGGNEGPQFNSAKDMVLDSARNRILIIDELEPSLFSVDINTGERTIISSGAVGGGPAFESPASIKLDPGTDTVYLLEGDSATTPGLMSIDLETGDRAYVSHDTLGTGPAFGFPRYFALDPANNRALMPDGDSLIEINITTGDRTPLFTLTDDKGPLTSLGEIYLDGPNGILYNRAREGLFAIHLSTGDNVAISR